LINSPSLPIAETIAPDPFLVTITGFVTVAVETEKSGAPMPISILLSLITLVTLLETLFAVITSPTETCEDIAQAPPAQLIFNGPVVPPAIENVVPVKLIAVPSCNDIVALASCLTNLLAP
jgi:hypothetical protein